MSVAETRAEPTPSAPEIHAPDEGRLLILAARGAQASGLLCALGLLLLGWRMASAGAALVGAVLLIGSMPLLEVSVSRARRGRIDSSVAWSAAAAWILALALAPLGARLLAATTLIALLPILLALPYVSGPHLRRILGVSVGVLVVGALLSLRPPLVTASLDDRSVQVLVGTSVSLLSAVCAFIVWKAHERLQHSRTQVAAATERHEQAEQSLREEASRSEQLEIDKARLRRANEELGELNELARVLNSSLDIDQVLQATLQAVGRIVPVDQMGILRLDPEDQTLKLDRQVGGAITPERERILKTLGFPLDAEESAIVGAARARRTAYFARIAEPLLSPTDWAFYQHNPVKTLLFSPLEVQGELVGGAFYGNTEEFVNLSIEDIQTLERYSTAIATAVVNATLHEEVRDARVRLARELEIGRQVQTGFLPEDIPQPAGWEIAALFEPAREMSGDFYDCFTVGSHGHVALVVADVCDKGVGAALFMSIFRSLLRATLDGAIAGLAPGAEIDVPRLVLHTVRGTNDYVAENHGASNMFATMFVSVLEPTTGRFIYVNGGHEAPAVVGTERVRERLRSTGPAVGMMAGLEFTVAETRLAPGETVTIFTDGVTEAHNYANELFSEERLLEILAQPHSSAGALVTRIREEVRIHAGGREPSDDVTLLAAHRLAAT